MAKYRSIPAPLKSLLSLILIRGASPITVAPLAPWPSYLAALGCKGFPCGLLSTWAMEAAVTVL